MQRRQALGARALAATQVVVSLLVLAATAACSDGSAPEEVEPRGEIAFTVNRSGFGEIWVMDAEGRGRRRLTEPTPPDSDATGSSSPAWSPNGSLIAFSSSGEAVAEDERDVGIYVMRGDGSGGRRLTDDGVLDTGPAWSPDGRRIAFARMRGIGSERPNGVIMVMSPEGTERLQLTRQREAARIVFDADPAWSPDGTTIAFTRATFRPDGTYRANIHTLDAGGRAEMMLIRDGGEPSWSPDGRMIAFTSTRDRFGQTCFHECEASGEIYVARADGTNLRRLTVSPANDHSPAWAPDGRRIAFVSDRSDRQDHENEIYVMGIDGGGIRRLTRNHVWDLEPSWRPSG